MCATSAFVVFLCLLMPPAATAPFAQPDYDRVQPAALNEAALRRLAHGDEGTSLILRERAAVLGGNGAAAPAAKAADMNWTTLPALWPAR
jgi:hypothetical protein